MEGIVIVKIGMWDKAKLKFYHSAHVIHNPFAKFFLKKFIGYCYLTVLMSLKRDCMTNNSNEQYGQILTSFTDSFQENKVTFSISRNKEPKHTAGKNSGYTFNCHLGLK